MSRALAAIASQVIGRRVRLTCGTVGTVTRVTAAGMVVTVPGITHEHVAEWLRD